MHHSLLFADHLNRYLKLYGEKTDHLEDHATQEAIGMHELVVLDALRMFAGEVVTASSNTKHKDAGFYLRFGAGRRLNMIRHGFESIRSILPPDRETPLKHKEVQDFNRDLNIIYMNTRGLLDNFAWAILYELNPEMIEECKNNLMEIHLFSRKTALKAIGDQNASKILKHEEWNKDLKKRRDPVAHRIPLCMPPTILLGDEEVEKYKKLQDDFNSWPEHMDFDKVEDSFKKMDEVGRCFPYFQHHPDDDHIPVYPTVPEDIGHLISIGRIVLDCLKVNTN